jgi:nicotinate-nucleotide pyrophosphorylase (carboxylating)
MRPDAERVDRLVDDALAEDRGAGDVTTETTVPAGARAVGRLVAKAPGRLAGLAVFARAFERVDPLVRTELRAADGDEVRPGDVVALVRGPARALLVAERTALNFVQRMSGIATLTARFVERASSGGGARILDTRKTAPSLRLLDKYAVRCGGGENHRFGLFDAAMVKDNHLDLAGRPLEALVRELRDRHPGLHVTAEARDEAEARAAARAGAHVVLLDNLAPEELARLCPVVREEARAAGHVVELEASGGIDLDNVADFARAGVDRISVGALTHSAAALDLSFLVEPEA